MRKWIILTFLLVGITCALISCNSADPSISALQSPLAELPPSLLEDLIFVQNNAEPELSVSFSHKDFFYDDAISVTISANNDQARIYYTTDGSAPTCVGEEFIHPLEFAAEETVSGVVLKAVAIYDGEQSPVLTQSYFIGTSIDARFSTYVFSLSVDADNLYDYESGILVSGRTYDDYMAEFAYLEEDDSDRPANYYGRGSKWERPVYVEVFTPEGDRVISQNAGIRVHGGSSRYYPVKSFMLIARKAYEPGAGKFKYDFFSDFLSTDGYRRPITSHDRIILRPGGSDITQSRIRTPLVSQITQGAGFSTVSPQAGAAVFLNGEYYGFAWITVQINEQFLESLFDAPEQSFEVLTGGNTDIITDDEAILSSFYQLLDYAEYGEGSDEAIQYICDYFDVDEMLLYYAIRTYTGDYDWPDNNVMIWRYTGSSHTENHAKELDGRWRFRFYDADSSLWYSEFAAPYVKSITRLLYDDMNNPIVYGRLGNSPVIRALLERTEHAEKFSNYLCDMMFEHFSAENVEMVMDELNEISLHEMEYSTLHGAGADWIGMEHILESRAQLIAFSEQRPDFILEEMRAVFGYTSLYRIVSDGSAKINTLNGNEGFYFIENRVPVTPVLSKGQAFDHWLINGEKHHEENLLLSIGDANADGVVNIQMVTKEELPSLFFEDTYDTGELYGFTMYNPTDTVQNTKRLYLSDDINNLKKWRFPNLNISPGAVWEFVGQNCTSFDSLLKIGLNFNPRSDEVIFLSNEDGIILDYIVMMS